MKYQNKKGFVLLETLTVTIFTLIIFTILYTSVVPLLGRYDALSYYNDLDITYDLYYVKKMLLADSNYESISNLDYKNITCGSLNDIETCQEYFQALNINPNNGDKLVYLNLSNEDVKNNSSLDDDIKDYLKYIDVNGKILLLKKNDYISYLKMTSKFVKDQIIESINNPSDSSCRTKVVEDGITYISGTKECIDFNYVWYSGKLWRVTAIYPDGTMKMITDDVITTISYNSSDNVNFYTDNENKSYMYQWLNEDFLDTLYNYENIIVTDSKWNSLTTTSGSTKIIEGATGVTTTTAPVSLFNSYEYYMSYKNDSVLEGYLDIGYEWWLLNPYSTSYVWYVNYRGDHKYHNQTSELAVRPSINLKSGIQLSGGSGTKTDPYTIAGDKEEVTSGTTLLNTRSSGEYVKFNNELYRIVSIENEITKINKNDYVRDTSNNVLKKQFSTSVTYGGGTTDDYWDYYLNNTWYNALDTTSKNMIVESTYYMPIVSIWTSYKKALCATASNTVTTKNCKKTTSTWIGLVGLPRYGEMFASQQGSGYSSSSNIGLMNPSHPLEVRGVNSSGCGSNIELTGAFAVRPSINLKSSIKITGGKGTRNNPFEISL